MVFVDYVYETGKHFSEKLGSAFDKHMTHFPARCKNDDAFFCTLHTSEKFMHYLIGTPCTDA